MNAVTGSSVGGDAAAPSRRPDRPALVHGVLALFAVAIVAKAAQVQLFQSARWRESAARQQVADASLPAPRGVITDASGRVLVESRQLVTLRVAPRELKDPARTRRLLLAAGVAKDWAKRATDTTRAWVEIPGRFLPSDVASITAQRGVHPQPIMDRVFSASEGVRRIVGRVGPDGQPVDGIELALDTVLRGTRGTALLLRDAKGGRLESPQVHSVAAQPGHSITLTLNLALQDICERALGEAVANLGATGGDVVVMEPRTAEVLAMASHRSDPRATAATAISEPFEPGSTIKPFTAAALLARGRARPDEVVNTENGQWTFSGRTITDVHKAASMTMRDVIRFSSNIGIVKLAQRLQAREQYEALRDFGFGTPTGVPYPAESPGRLRVPGQWSNTSNASLAMGYELAVTPLQLATAYASIANGGELLEPSLVKEIRTADGAVRYRHERRVVRRVLTPELARDLRAMLKSVVDSGTATDADLASFSLGGKSGTVRRMEPGSRGYAAGHYNAVFAGIFPVDDPQFVIVVKIDNPSGVYYGGKTAAPLTKVVLQGALAARDASLDRASLASRVLPRARDAYRPRATALANSAQVAARPVVPADLQRESTTVTSDSIPQGPARVVVSLPARPTRAAVVLPPRAVPAVQGLPVRDALFALHRAGFRVRLADTAAGAAAVRLAARTLPAAGAVARAGSVVTLYRDP